MTIMISIPQDIIDNVIGHLQVHSDRDTLYSCSAVSHSFLIPARRKLFHAITLSNPTSAQLLNDLLLKSNNHISTCIRELYVTVGIWNESDESDGYDEIWFAEDQVLPKILELTQCLTLISLKLRAVTSWSSFSVELRSVVTKQLQLPTLIEARMYCICDFPSTIITDSSHLRKLVLNTVYFNSPSTDVTSGLELVYLEQLEFDGDGPNLPLLGMRNLRLLSISSFNSLSRMREVIQSSKHSIRSVLWDTTRSRSLTPHDCKFSYCLGVE